MRFLRVFIWWILPFTHICILHAQYPVESGIICDRFIIPDTVCVFQDIFIDPDTLSGSDFHWTFCSANAGSNPLAVQLGNPSGVLDNPTYIALVRNDSDCFTFISNTADSSIVRIHFGSSYSNDPIGAEALHINLLTSKIRGLQVLWEYDKPLGFIVDGTILYRFTFSGDTLFGQPQIVDDIFFSNVGTFSGLKIQRLETGWVGFITDSEQDKLIRLYFPNQLTSPPLVNDLGNIGNLDGPNGLSMITIGGEHYLFVANEGSSTITRIDFGASYLNSNPFGTNLGNIKSKLNHNTGIEVIYDCNQVYGYVINNTTNLEALIRLDFNSGIEGIPDAVSLNISAGFDIPFGISELIRNNNKIVAMITGSGNSRLKRFEFLPCTGSSRPGDIVRDPDPFHYLYAGEYNIYLSWMDSSNHPQELCKHIIVVPEVSVDLGPDQTICEGDQAILNAGQGYSTYYWSTGQTTQVIEVTHSGSYWVKIVSGEGCEATDTIEITVEEHLNIQVDTSLCFGERYFAGGEWRTEPGTYYDTLKTSSGCEYLLTTNLAFKPAIEIDLGNDTTICPGEEILLDATVQGGVYLWQDGTTDSEYMVTNPGCYRVEITVVGCTVNDSILVGDCPAKIWFPNAFTPDNDGLNDVFRPVGINILNFRMLILDRWGERIFETTSVENGWDGSIKGGEAPCSTYSFIVFYETKENQGTPEKITGTVTLIR